MKQKYHGNIVGYNPMMAKNGAIRGDVYVKLINSNVVWLSGDSTKNKRCFNYNIRCFSCFCLRWNVDATVYVYITFSAKLKSHYRYHIIGFLPVKIPLHFDETIIFYTDYHWMFSADKASFLPIDDFLNSLNKYHQQIQNKWNNYFTQI